MNAEDILYIIDRIPQYIKYVYPGYLSIYIYFYLKGQSPKESKSILFKSIAISYIYISVVDNWGKFDAVGLNIILIIIALLLPYVYYILNNRGFIQFVYKCLRIKASTKKNEIEQIQGQEGTWLAIYLKDKDIMYEGSLSSWELDNVKGRFICLSGYRQYYINKDNKYKRELVYDYANQDHEKIIIYYDNIDRIETR